MASPTDPVSILERIRHLEQELVGHWKKVSQLGHESSEDIIWALQIMSSESTFLVPIDSIREVVSMLWPEPLAEAPPWVLGTFSFGSETVPMIDVGLRLTKKPTKVSLNLYVVIIDKPRWLSLVVEDIGDVVELDTTQLTSAGPEIPHAPFLLAVSHSGSGDMSYVLSPGSLGRELDE